jgi:predicted nucleic acid-binding protein
VAERRGRLAAADSARFVSLLLRLPIAVEHWHPERIMKEVLDLGREKKLSSYDASYLSLAMTKGYPIATINTNMLKAARELGVEVLSTHNT